MLNPEIAEAQLKQWEVEGYQRLREARVALLPADLRDTALAIYDVNHPDPPYTGDNREAYEKRQEARRLAYVHLAQLAPADRTRLFAAWFPGLETSVERGYGQFARLPYQTGGSRKSFRAPGLDETRAVRNQWLMQLLNTLTRYGVQSLTWWAAWTPYISGSADALGLLFAAAIDAGDPQGEEVFDVLLQSGRGEHEIAAFGRHVCRAFLVASRREGWEFIEKMLLAAQRQEGLRQVILETVDEAHPDAFARMLRVILDNDLCRFSAVIRAVDVWFGFGYDALNNRAANATIAQTLTFLENVDARAEAIAKGDPNALYLALWAGATHDATQVLPLAAALLAPDAEPNNERRYVAAYFLGQLNLAPARAALVPALDDPDAHVKWTAFGGIGNHAGLLDGYPDMFERVERFFAGLTGKKEGKEDKTLPPIVWPWQTVQANAPYAANMLVATLGERSPRRLLPYMSLFHSYQKGHVIDLIVKAGDRESGMRDLLFQFVEDRDMTVVQKALAALKKLTLAPSEVQDVEELLKRTGSEYRRGVQNLLLTLPDASALQSAQRLLSATNAPQRAAGLEMLDQMLRATRSADACRELARAFGDTPVKKTGTETRLLGSLLNPKREEATLVNGLGLFDPDKRTLAPPPVLRDVQLVTPAALACLQSLDALIEANREMPLKIKDYAGTDEMLLGDVKWQFPSPPQPKPAGAKTTAASTANPDDEAEQATPPLNDLWETWWSGRPEELRDPDGLELLRAHVAEQFQNNAYAGRWYEKPAAWMLANHDALYGEVAKMQPKHTNVLGKVVQWLLYAHPIPDSGVDFLLDAVETSFARVPLDEALKSTDVERFNWRGNHTVTVWQGVARAHRLSAPHLWKEAHDVRLFHLVKWLDQPTVRGEAKEKGTRNKEQEEAEADFTLMKHMPRARAPFVETLRAYVADAATEADVLDHLIGEQTDQQYSYSRGRELGELSGRIPPAWSEAYPFLKPLVERIRTRVLEVELARGDAPTAATQVVRNLRWSGGMDVLLTVLHLLGKDTLTRSSSGSYDSRINSFSHLIRAAFPGKTDTPEGFARLAGEAKISPARLIELAMYAPQWAAFVEHALGWAGLAEAVWWIHAHTKDHQWNVAQELKDEWAAQSAERTPLSSESLMGGAVDVAWFHRVYDLLGEERWKQLDEAAKYASSTGGHKRAQLFADAMLGRLDKAQLVTRIKDKRNQDALRALGLIPLDGGDVESPPGQSDALSRYKTIQEFVRTSRQFGAQRQQSEKLAASMGLENLARTSGFADPARLEWAMEAGAVADLANGPISVEAGGAVVTLSINALGKPGIAITRAGKPLKAVPAAAKKDPAVMELQERKRDIDRQGSRMRLSLEQAMCRGDRFTGGELPNLMAHPVLAPMLRSVVFVVDAPQSVDSLLPAMKNTENKRAGEEQAEDASSLSLGARIAGYPTPFGRTLESVTGDEIELAPDTLLRIAHPYDLLHTGAWDKWQSDCFRRERVQPFKQIFRELYVLTENESDQKNISHRYDGQQLNPKQAMALLGSRGWVASYEQGPRRTFHDADITASLWFFEGYSTPAEIEGLTINGVYFTRRGEWQPLPLTQVPPRVFSEAMRDLDLVVSVAHQGGVDPEASASTVEMRASLLRESLLLLHITNVRLQGSHALIDGKLGTYTLHLGSASVHRQPGGALCIVPVHSQHRGRLFLPFADDDPKTAEVISKVLLLANDTQIKDLIILEQILVKR